MMLDNPALEVADVSHRFGKRQALRDVSLRVERGSFTALLGPNGAGKTTLFALITRLYNTREGQVRIFGRELEREPSAALAEMGVVFQKPTLDSDLTVRQNLAYHASAAWHERQARPASRIEELLARVGLADRAKDKVRTLSGGQSRRIEIARSLVHGPRLLLLDEATVGLDLASRADIVRIVRDLVREDGLSVLWATHIFDEVEATDSTSMCSTPATIVTPGPAPTRSPRGASSRASSRMPSRALTVRHHADRSWRDDRYVTASATPHRSIGLAGYAHLASSGITKRELLKFVNQKERFFSALVRPLIWLFIFAAGFRSALGVSIIPIPIPTLRSSTRSM